MPLIEVNPTMLPGEAGLVALANLFTELAKDLGADEKNRLADRFLTLTEPYHAINVAISQNVARLIAKVLHIDVKDVQTAPATPAAKAPAE